jgi:hypothetical protein
MPDAVKYRVPQAAFPESHRARALEAAAEAAEAAAKGDEAPAEDADNGSGGGAGGVGGGAGGERLPIFYLDCILPRQRLQLNVFEARYRLMIRRSLEVPRGIRIFVLNRIENL